MRDIPDCEWLQTWTALEKSFAFCHNPALQPRALIVFGCISKYSGQSVIIINFYIKKFQFYQFCFRLTEMYLCPTLNIHQCTMWLQIMELGYVKC